MKAQWKIKGSRGVTQRKMKK
uniref:Uncharacterized protein n=1 Tax=Anguilla anguilla TaxID=7936 RepID=A0A0E9TX88_ANGAN